MILTFYDAIVDELVNRETLWFCHFERSEKYLELLRNFSSLRSSKSQKSTFYETIIVIGSTKKWADEGKIDISPLGEPAAARVHLPQNRFFIPPRSPRG
jgi:hypothetical protein